MRRIPARRRPAIGLFPCLLACAACGSLLGLREGTEREDGGSPDAGVDVGVDADAAPDADACPGVACGDTCCTSLVAFATGLTCTAGACDYTECAPNAQDLDGDRTNGCESVNPLGVPEAPTSLLLWLVAEQLDGSPWHNRANTPFGATCTSCPTPTTGPGGQVAVSFDGKTQTVDLSGDYNVFSGGLTVLLVWQAAPDPVDGGPAAAYEPIVDFNSPLDGPANYARVMIYRTGTTSAFTYQACHDTSCPYVDAPIWDGTWQRTTVEQQADGTMSMSTNGAVEVLNNTIVPVPWDVSRTVGHLGSDAYGRFYAGKLAEIVVFDKPLPASSEKGIQSYFHYRYGL